MQGGGKGRGRERRGKGNRIPPVGSIDPATCPHKWVWTQPHSTGSTYHEQWKYCVKCHLDVRERKVSKHDFSHIRVAGQAAGRGICECGETNF